MNGCYHDVPTPGWVEPAAAIIPPPRRDEVEADTIDGEIVLWDPRDETAFYLNETAAVVWRSCDGTTSTAEIARRLVERYEVPWELALDNVEQVAAWFAESGLLRGAE